MAGVLAPSILGLASVLFQVDRNAVHAPPMPMPRPLKVAVAFWDGWISGRLASATWTAFGLLAIALLIGASLAAFLAVFAIRTRVGDDLLTLLAFALGPIPAIAVLLLLVVLFDAGTDALMLVAVCTVVLPIATTVFDILAALIALLTFLFIREWGSLTALSLPADLAERTLLGCSTGPAPDAVQVYPPSPATIHRRPCVDALVMSNPSRYCSNNFRAKASASISPCRPSTCLVLRR
jgi:ABC-type nitrate/sulfonate/bicarbonate transport system permease component